MGNISCDGFSSQSTGLIRKSGNNWTWGWGGTTQAKAVHPYIATLDTSYVSEIFTSEKDILQPKSLQVLFFIKY